MEKVTRTVLQ